MNIRDISLYKRLLITNMLMVLIPVLILAVIGIVLMTGLRSAGTARQNDLAAIWPQRGPALSIQYALNGLRAESIGRHGQAPDINEMKDEISILENQGIHVAIIYKDEPVYVTEGVSAENIKNKVIRKTGDKLSGLLWDDEGMAFVAAAPPPHPMQSMEKPAHKHNMGKLNGSHGHVEDDVLPPRHAMKADASKGTVIYAEGRMPFLAQTHMRPGPAKEVFQRLLTVSILAAVFLIVMLGWYLSRVLLRQILEPLQLLRASAAAIREGDLDTTVHVNSNDEIGEVCKDFDDMREALRKAAEQRARDEAGRRELIAGISHDIATPLTLLKGYSDGLIAGVAKTPEKRHKYLERISHAADTMAVLVDQLFTFSKLELGRIEFKMENVDMGEFIKGIVDDHADSLCEQGVRLNVKATASDARALIDRMQMTRVFTNIISNSCKYNEQRPLDIDISLECRDQMYLKVADHGRGVPEALLPKLFESFYRVDSARTDNTTGSGLGLAICREIIIQMGGSIIAENTPGGGLTINIILPCHKEDVS